MVVENEISIGGIDTDSVYFAWLFEFLAISIWIKQKVIKAFFVQNSRKSLLTEKGGKTDKNSISKEIWKFAPKCDCFVA